MRVKLILGSCKEVTDIDQRCKQNQWLEFLKERRGFSVTIQRTENKQNDCQELQSSSFSEGVCDMERELPRARDRSWAKRVLVLSCAWNALARDVMASVIAGAFKMISSV